MKQPFVLLKYCARYLIAFLAVLAICLPIILATRNTLTDKLLKESEIYLDNGLAVFDDTVAQMLQLSNNISSTSDFITVSKIQDDPNNSILAIRNLNDSLNEMSLLFETSPFFFVLFENNNVFVSSQQASYDLDNYFGTMLDVKDETGESLGLNEFKEQIFSSSSTFSAQFFNDFSAYYDGAMHTSEEMVIFIIRSSFYDLSLISNPYCICFAIPKAELISSFVSPTLATSALFELQMPTGEPLLMTAGDIATLQVDAINTDQTVTINNAQHWLLQDTSPTNNWLVTIGIPTSVINQELNGVLYVLYCYIAVGFLIVLFLTVRFAYQQYDTIQRFHSALEGNTQQKSTHSDPEFAKLYDIIQGIKENEKEFHARSIELQHMKTNSILAHYIVHGAKSPLAFVRFQECIPADISCYCVVYVQINTQHQSDYDYAVLAMLEYLKTPSDYQFINFHTGINREVFFVKVNECDTAHLEKIATMFYQLTNALQDGERVVFHVGISELGEKISDAHRYFNQANDIVRASMYQAFQSPVTIFTKEIALGTETIVDIHYLERFHQLLLLGKHQEITELFDSMLKHYKQNVLQFEVYKQQTYYSIQNLIFSAGLNFKSMELMHAILPAYSAYDNIDTTVDKFLQSSLMICDWVQENAQNQTFALAQEVEDYIAAHFADCDLSTYVTSQALGVSESKLQNALKQKRGKSFSVYLEQVRIEQAVIYLENTNMSNEDICTHTGFSALSTFYRVFNKWKGVSPGAWRTQRK